MPLPEVVPRSGDVVAEEVEGRRGAGGGEGGSDGLRLRCYYQNDTDRDVHFGTRFEDEMCFLWLYYYEQ